jgi:hypothetical protein
VNIITGARVNQTAVLKLGEKESDAMRAIGALVEKGVPENDPRFKKALAQLWKVQGAYEQAAQALAARVPYERFDFRNRCLYVDVVPHSRPAR